MRRKALFSWWLFHLELEAEPLGKVIEEPNAKGETLEGRLLIRAFSPEHRQLTLLATCVQTKFRVPASVYYDYRQAVR